MIPTINQVMKIYATIAGAERMKTGRPGARTVANVLRGSASVCAAAGVSLESEVGALTRQAIDAALVTFLKRGLARLTAWSYVMQLRGLFARWALPYYRDRGWTLPPLDLPTFRAKAPRYVRPSEAQLAAVKAWYLSLTDARLWFAATMMLEFAMRNGDVLRLKDENFVAKGNLHYLSYTPHKTELTSGRRVCWPVHPGIWARIGTLGGVSKLDLTDEIFARVNRDLRALGFTGSKGAYELRKICIDHIYQKYGAEMAVSISGDDIKTISRYYADPSAVNVIGVRIVDLL